jgi:uncharacterized NAD(P)/FAD-binding protein YdhS
MTLSPRLAAIAAELDRRRRLDSAALASVLRMELTLDDVAPFVRFDEHNYERRFVASGKRWELRLLCWRPNQSSSLHGHGGSACAFRILSGAASEIVVGRRDRTWIPGDVVDESDRALVHQVGNFGRDALLSLHAYSPALPVDRPSSPDGRTIAIVGGGFAGVAVAYHLLRTGPSDLRVTIVESGPWLGRGVAYALESPLLRLNVPAARMSLDPDAPDDFVAYANASDDPNAFLPRSVYGAYVEDRLASVIRESPAKLRVIRGRAIAIDDRSLILEDGRRVPAERIVLASGHARAASADEDPRLIDGWDECALAGVPSDARVLVIGSGLTALDVLAVLDARGHRGAIDVVSRHGLLPRAHVSPAALATIPDACGPAPSRLVELLAWGRAVVREAERAGEPWQHAIDAIRPLVPELWRRLSPADRARFVRSVRAYWDVLRHRAPADVLERVGERVRDGAVTVRAGTVLGCEPAADGVAVAIRRGGAIERARYDAVVRCTGPAIRGADALSASLVRERRAKADPAGLGIVTSPDGRVVDPAGRKSDRLFAIGAPARASRGESTSVPEIARAAGALARTLTDTQRRPAFVSTVIGLPAPV